MTSAMTTVHEPPEVRLGRLGIQNLRRTNPEHADSFDELDSTCGVFSLWNVAGRVKDVWDTLQDPVSAILLSNQVRLQATLKGAGAKNPYALLRCYMVGMDKDHAIPYVAFVCAKRYREYAREAKRTILRHGILKEFGWGFLCYYKTVQFSADEREIDPIPAETQKSPASEGRSLHAPSNPGLVPLPGPAQTSTRRLEVTDAGSLSIFGEEVSVGSRRGTIGGIVCANGVFYGITVAHLFNSEHECGPDDSEFDEIDSLFDDDELELDSDIDTSDEELGQEASTTFDSTDTTTSTLTPTVSRLAELPSVLRLGQGDTVDHSVLASPNSDYAIFELSEETQGQFHSHKMLQHWDEIRLSVAVERIAVPVSREGDNGLLFGKPMHSSSIFLDMTNGHASKVYTVSFPPSDMPKPGDCGSLVIQYPSRTILGIVSAVSGALNEAYIVPYETIIAGIRYSLGTTSIGIVDNDGYPWTTKTPEKVYTAAALAKRLPKLWKTELRDGTLTTSSSVKRDESDDSEHAGRKSTEDLEMNTVAQKSDLEDSEASRFPTLLQAHYEISMADRASQARVIHTHSPHETGELPTSLGGKKPPPERQNLQGEQSSDISGLHKQSSSSLQRGDNAARDERRHVGLFSSVHLFGRLSPSGIVRMPANAAFISGQEYNSAQTKYNAEGRKDLDANRDAPMTEEIGYATEDDDLQPKVVSSSADGRPRKLQEGSSGTKIYYWTCHMCAYGPMNTEVVAACAHCEHKLCKQCRMVIVEE